MATVAETQEQVQAPADMPQPGWNIFQRLAWVARQVEYIRKDSYMEAMDYTYVSHDKVVRMYRPHILKAGLFLITDVVDQTVHQVEGNYGKKAFQTTVKIAFTFVNVDNPSERVTYHMCGQGLDSNDKGSGKAISYTCKYGLLKPFLAETGEDADKENIDFNAPKIKTPPETDEAAEASGSAEYSRAHIASMKSVNAAIRNLMAEHNLTAEAVEELAGKSGKEMSLSERQRLLAKLEAKYGGNGSGTAASCRDYRTGEMPMAVAYKLIQNYRDELGETDDADWNNLISIEMGKPSLDELTQVQLDDFARRLEQRVLAQRSGVLQPKQKGEGNGK